jgi:hydrogenase/urease accessory protein HupE
MKFGVAVVLLWLMAPVALAHSPIKGLDSFYAGVLHPVFVPAHVMSVLVLGILIGQQGVKPLQLAVMAFLLSVGGGLIVTGLYPEVQVGSPLLAVAALVAVLVAWCRPMPQPVYAVVAVVLGMLLGMDSVQSELTGRARWAALLGSGIAIYLLTLYAMVFAEYFSRHAWQRIGLRVIGSWIAAAALLVLSLRLSVAA